MQGKILVVDDEFGIREVFREFLKGDGYAVTVAENFDGAMRAAEAETFDLVFSDIMLGGKSGLDVLKGFKTRQPAALVILVTGFPNMETIQEALRHGAFDYIPKPVMEADLLRLAKTAMKHKRLWDEREAFRQNLEAIFRSVKDAIITVDRQGNLAAVNNAAESICGIPASSVGQPFHTIPRYCVEKFQEIFTTVFEQKRDVEFPNIACQTEGGGSRVLNVTASPLLNEGGVFAGAVMVIRDDTRLIKLEKNLKQRRQFHRIIGQSAAMQKVYDLIENLADVETTVLIIGETGSGKELVAEALHYQGTRSDKPMVSVNCSALTDTLLESELFGHVKGAFTGAIKDRVGRFELADKGTIFLDEIGDISANMQMRLLRVLQEKEVERVGGSASVQVDTRVVTATNQDLTKKVADKSFREDLFYRLKVVQINLPPLRDRREDIPLLTEHFIERFNDKFGKSVRGVSEGVMQIFMGYRWPGNVRELEHAIEHAFVVCRNTIIDVGSLPPELTALPPSPATPPGEFPVSRPGPASEKEALLEALRTAGWVKTKAARIMGFSRSTMYRKLKEYGLEELEEKFLP